MFLGEREEVRHPLSPKRKKIIQKPNRKRAKGGRLKSVGSSCSGSKRKGGNRKREKKLITIKEGPEGGVWTPKPKGVGGEPRGKGPSSSQKIKRHVEIKEKPSCVGKVKKRRGVNLKNMRGRDKSTKADP